MRLGLLEDDPQLGELFEAWLEDAGHEVIRFTRGQALISALRRETYDLLILDWMVPDIDGKEVLEWVRGNVDWPIPIIFVTQRAEEEDIVDILLRGADDYLIKPIRRREMIARITALARRSKQHEGHSPLCEFPPYHFDVALQTVRRDETTTKLTQKEFELALFLFRNAGRVLSRDYIMANVWGQKPGINTRTVDTHVSRLRNKLELAADNGWILTGIYHHGYRLEQIESTVDDASHCI